MGCLMIFNYILTLKKGEAGKVHNFFMIKKTRSKDFILIL